MRKASAVHAQVSDAKGNSVSVGAEVSECAEMHLRTGRARQTTEHSVHGELKQEDGAGNAQSICAELKQKSSAGNGGPDEFCTKLEVSGKGKAGISLKEVTESSLQKNGRHTHVEVKQSVDVETHVTAEASVDVQAASGDGVRVAYEVPLIQGKARLLEQGATIDSNKGMLSQETRKEITAATQGSAEKLNDAAEAKMAEAADNVVPPGVAGATAAAWRGDHNAAKKAMVAGGASAAAKGLAAVALTSTTTASVPAAGLAGSLGFTTLTVVTTGPGVLVLGAVGWAAGAA
ncbi:unnamed protein product, partial [Symbiodinium sp. CCMP2456]